LYSLLYTHPHYVLPTGVQERLHGMFGTATDDLHRIMPYGITVGALTVIFVWIMLALIYQGRLLPGVVIVGSFILLILYITGIIETALQLFRNTNGIIGQCNSLNSYAPAGGLTVDVLAYLELQSICQSWEAVFAFWIVGAVFFLWMIVLGSQVSRSGGRGGG